MLNDFYKKFSLSNVKEDKPRGQIATLLILIIVVVLIFILTTVNLGQLSLYSTNLSNVADSSALYLGSQLASRANQISQSLVNSCGDPMKCCKKGGFGGLFGAIIGAFIAIVITVATWGWGAYGAFAIAAGFIGGAVGGAVGAATAGTSVMQGAFQGAMIGAAMGAAAYAGAAGFGAESTLFTPVSAGDGIAAQAAGSTVFWEGSQAYVLSTTLIPSTIGAVGVGALSTGASIYNAYVADQNQAAAFAAASRMLNGLPDYDRFRESVFLQAFSQTVDDPNKDTDFDDLNGNGNVNEKVPHFLSWWEIRTGGLKAIIPFLKDKTNSFFYGDLVAFKDYISGITSAIDDSNCDNSECFWNTNCCAKVPGVLSRQEDDGVDGLIARVGRALNVPFINSTGSGSLEEIEKGFKAFVAQNNEDMKLTNLDQLTSNWQTFIENFYNEDYGKPVLDENGNPVKDENGDPVTVTDYYHGIEEVKGCLADWKAQIIDKRDHLSPCVIGAWNWNWNWWAGDGADETTCQPCYGSAFCPYECLVTEPPEEASPIPCKFGDPVKDGTIDYSYNKNGDDIITALNEIDGVIPELTKFQNKIKAYVEAMKKIYKDHEDSVNGLNPAVYGWTDSRGDHSVSVEVGKYQVAHTITTESGGSWSKEICIRLADYYDNGSNTWVRITRSDPQSKELKSGRVSLGAWNPFVSGKIAKRGKSSYSYNWVRSAP